MEQHRCSNEQCLTWQRWNQLSKAEQTKEAWEAWLEYAQRLRLTRRTDAPEFAAETRGVSPALTVASSKGRGQKPAAATSKVVAASSTEKKQVKKKRVRSEESTASTPL